MNIIRSWFMQRSKEYWVVFSYDSVSQKRSYRFGNLTDSHSHSLKKIDEVFLTLKKLPTHSDLEFSNMSNLDQWQGSQGWTVDTVLYRVRKEKKASCACNRSWHLDFAKDVISFKLFTQSLRGCDKYMALTGIFSHWISPDWSLKLSKTTITYSWILTLVPTIGCQL